MKRRDQTRRNRGRAALAVLRRPAASWLAVLTLLLQIAFSAAPAASSEQRAAAALSAAIGQQVSLCAQGEHSGAPNQSCPCCDDCALCGLACGGAPAPVSERIIALLAPERVAPAQFPTNDQAVPRPPVVVSSARPRAPPLSI